MPVKTNQGALYIADEQGHQYEWSGITGTPDIFSSNEYYADEKFIGSLKPSGSISFEFTMSKKDARRFLRALKATWYWKLYYRIRWKINKLIHKERTK